MIIRCVPGFKAWAQSREHPKCVPSEWSFRQLPPPGLVGMVLEPQFSAFFYGTLLHPKILRRVIGNDGSHLEICPAVLLVSTEGRSVQ